MQLKRLQALLTLINFLLQVWLLKVHFYQPPVPVWLFYSGALALQNGSFPRVPLQGLLRSLCSCSWEGLGLQLLQNSFGMGDRVWGARDAHVGDSQTGKIGQGKELFLGLQEF